MRLTQLIESCENLKEHAIDSDKMLAMAYHTRRLQLKSWKALLLQKLNGAREMHSQAVARHFY